MPDTAKGANLTVKDLSIDASKSQRGINYNTTGSLTLENVDVTAANYAVNLPGSAVGAEVSISNSELNGLNTLNIWGKDSNITVTNTEINTYDKNSKEDYAPIAINNNLSTAASGATITLNGGSVNYYLGDSTSPAGDMASILNAAGAKVNNNSCTLTGISVSPAGILDSGAYINTPQECVDYSAENNVTVKLLRNVELNTALVIKGDASIDPNGKNISITSNGSVSFDAEAPADAKLTLEGDFSDEVIEAVRAALPNFCVSEGSIIIKASHTGGTASCAAQAECTVCGEPYGKLLSHDYTYSVDSAKPNVINESCSNCTTHKATASIQLKKSASTVYTGSAITPLEVSYSVSGSTMDQWQGGNLSITYANNTEPGTATGSITKGTATAKISFTIEPEELKMWEHNDYHRETGKDLSFTIETDGRYIHHIVSVKLISGKSVTELRSSQFSTSAKDGDIILTVSRNTMEKLGVGRYSLEVEMAANNSDTVHYYSSDAFRVRYPLFTPPTGDSANFLLWGGLLMGATIALGGSLIILKKGKKN